MNTLSIIAIVWITIIWITIILLSFAFWKRIGDIEIRARDASQNLQIQLAFISGRIGLSKRDLDRVKEKPEDPPVSTEVLGSLDNWTDLDEEFQEEPEASEKGRG